MKSFIISISLLLLTVNFYSQIPSSCEGDIEIEESYQLDAEVLALEHIYENELTFIDSVNIPDEISESIQGALMAVYNAVGIPERDSVVSLNNLHTFPLYILNSVLLVADTALPWTQDLSNDVFPTSEPTLNDLMITYGMTVVNTYPIGSSLLVEFVTEQSYNIIALSSLLEDIPSVDYSEPNGYIGDGNDIQVSITDSYIELDYSLGWGDCPSGCICRRHWVFHVYPDCSVEFINSYGCSLEPVGIEEIDVASFNIYPNPFIDHFLIDKIIPGSSFIITNQFGQTVREDRIVGNSISHLGDLSPGVYFLTISNDGNSSTVSLIKE